LAEVIRVVQTPKALGAGTSRRKGRQKLEKGIGKMCAPEFGKRTRRKGKADC